MTLCLTLLLLLLLLNRFETKSKDREFLLKLAFQITLDLFDGIEMLQVILDRKCRNQERLESKARSHIRQV